MNLSMLIWKLKLWFIAWICSNSIIYRQVQSREEELLLFFVLSYLTWITCTRANVTLNIWAEGVKGQGRIKIEQLVYSASYRMLPSVGHELFFIIWVIINHNLPPITLVMSSNPVWFFGDHQLAWQVIIPGRPLTQVRWFFRFTTRISGRLLIPVVIYCLIQTWWFGWGYIRAQIYHQFYASGSIGPCAKKSISPASPWWLETCVIYISSLLNIINVNFVIYVILHPRPTWRKYVDWDMLYSYQHLFQPFPSL